MAVRSAQEISTSLRSMFGEQTPEGFVELLEDIADSVGSVDMSGYVTAEAAAALQQERDSAVAESQAWRDKYVNRFYNSYDKPNDKGYIVGSTSQESLQQGEEYRGYDVLFEGGAGF